MHCNACRRHLITGLTSAASPRVHISSTSKVGQKLGEILYLLIRSFLPCLSSLLCSRVRKSRRDLWITLYFMWEMQTGLYLGYSTVWTDRWRGVGGCIVIHAHPELTSNYVMHEQLSLSTFGVSAENESTCHRILCAHSWWVGIQDCCVGVAFTCLMKDRN